VNPFYPAVSERAGYRCEYCYAPEQVFNFTFEVEHIHPRASGGDDSPENLALACESCNLHKAMVTAGWDETEAREVALFDSRRDQWEEHFLVSEETAEIIGRTGKGRVTVQRLKMNSAFQIRARRHWMRLDLFP
jgi:hypothetical protein